MSTLDLRPAVTATAAVVAAVPGDDLTGSTPCPDWSVADLLDHLGGLAVAFTMSARKQPLDMTGGPVVDGSRLEPGWRDRIVSALHELGDAWATTPGAFEGRTEAGPIEMGAEEAALVGLNEVVVHGWDLAAATGAPYDVDPASAAACRPSSAPSSRRPTPPRPTACSAHRCRSRPTRRRSTSWSPRPAGGPTGPADDPAACA